MTHWCCSCYSAWCAWGPHAYSAKTTESAGRRSTGRISPPPFSLQVRLKQRCPQFVSLFAEMQSVRGEQFLAWHRVVAEHRLDDVEIAEPVVGLALRLDEFVRLADGVDEFPASEARLDRDEHDLRFRQVFLNRLDKPLS